MSYADKVFIDMCRDIIDNGVSTEGEKVRPKWEDGEYAYTMLDLDHPAPDCVIEELKAMDGVLGVRKVK